MKFEKPGIGDRMAQLGYLLKNTFTIFGRDRDILVPVFQMSLYAAVLVTLFFAGIAAIIVDRGGLSFWLLLIAFVLFVFKFFFYNRLELRLSRLVFDTASGRDATVNTVKNELAGMGSRTRILALLDMASVWIASQRGNGGFLTRLVLGAVVEIWDLVNHFLLPVFAIDKLGFKEGCERLTSLRNHVPETLAGVFGIDIMGGVLRSIMGPVYLVAGLGGVAAGLFFGAGLPASFSAGPLGDLFGTIPEALPFNEQTLFNWLPVFVLIYFAFVGNAILARLVTVIKVVYFTLFYSRIAHAEALAPDIRQELDAYLNLEEKPQTAS